MTDDIEFFDGSDDEDNGKHLATVESSVRLQVGDWVEIDKVQWEVSMVIYTVRNKRIVQQVTLRT